MSIGILMVAAIVGLFVVAGAVVLLVMLLGSRRDKDS